MVRGGETLSSTIVAEWQHLIFWALVVGFLSLFPIVNNEARLTMDEPILLALALLYPPEVAAVVALLAGFDVREMKREVTFSRAWFNRVQIGLSIYVAGAAFRLVTDGNLGPWPIAVIGTGAAVAAEYLANVLLVSLHARALFRLEFTAAVRRFTVGDAGQFLATHLGYGSLSLVLAHLFLAVGAWSVAMFLVPILVARQMLIRGQAIHALAEKLKTRDRLLERLSDRIVDERHDERQRVAGDLHDEVLQDLTRIWLSARLVEREQTASGFVSHDLRELVRASETSIESLRKMIRGLKESSTGWGGLIPTLQGLVRDLRLEWKANIRLTLPDALEINPPAQFVAYQVVREALINSLKHSGASLIDVSLLAREGVLAVEVQDNGAGFALETVDFSIHFGLALLEERVQKMGGHANIQSTPNEGTTVRAVFPLGP